MKTSIGYQLRACGRKKLPAEIALAGCKYLYIKTFKHDFFAATALYQACDPAEKRAKNVAEKVVLKQGRNADFLGIPLGWLGQVLCRHEFTILKHLQSIRGVPALLGMYGKGALVYEYIEGKSLDEKPKIPDGFFAELGVLLQQIHRSRVVYVDMNKRGNILLGANGRPYMVDFQISLHIPESFWPIDAVMETIFELLKKEDHYHLLKHNRRLRKDLMTDEQIRRSRLFSGWISMHRQISRPLTRLRRRVLRYLYHKDQLISDDVSGKTPENDPERWAGKNYAEKGQKCSESATRM